MLLEVEQPIYFPILQASWFIFIHLFTNGFQELLDEVGALLVPFAFVFSGINDGNSTLGGLA